MDEYQKKIGQEFREIVKDVLPDKELSGLKKKWQKEAEQTKTELELIKVCAFCNHDKNINQITQTNYFLEYDMLRHKELEFMKNKKDKEFLKEMKRVKDLICSAYKKVRENDEKRIIYHIELEKRLGFQFECDYMSAYLGAKIGEKK